MIIRSIEEVLGTERDVYGVGWRSRRMVVAADGLKYSIHETTLDAGVRLQFQYRNHRETVYCVGGEGTIEDVSAGRIVELKSGGLYSAGIGDDHIITTKSEMRLVCVFDPPLEGTEEAD